MNNTKNVEQPIIAISSNAKEEIATLKRMGVAVLAVPPYSSKLAKEVNFHIDMIIHLLGYKKILLSKNYLEENINFKQQLDLFGIDTVITNRTPTDSYPADILFNAVKIGDILLCNERYTDDKLLDYYKKQNCTLANTKQGYAKCSTCVINDKAAITTDRTIEKILKQHDVDVLYVTPFDIELSGYEYGFIGGASGMISERLLGFCGDVRTHRDYDKITKFAYKYDVEITALSKGKLYDYGSVFRIN